MALYVCLLIIAMYLTAKTKEDPFVPAMVSSIFPIIGASTVILIFGLMLILKQEEKEEN